MKRPPLEEGLITALAAIDTQVARELQRSPAEREVHGVRRWEPYQKRVELVTSFLLNSLGDEEVRVDGLVVLSQALTKALAFLAEDLHPEGLGKVRTEYLLHTFDQLARDARRGEAALKGSPELM